MMSIIDFDESEKRAVSSTDSTGRMQDVTFLTEKGLYKVLFRSRKPIAQRFQDWVCEVIKEIRLNGIYELQQEIVQKQKEFECKYDCIKSLAISDKTLTKALTKNIPYNGHYYREIGAKLKMV